MNHDYEYEKSNSISKRNKKEMKGFQSPQKYESSSVESLNGTAHGFWAHMFGKNT